MIQNEDRIPLMDMSPEEIKEIVNLHAKNQCEVYSNHKNKWVYADYNLNPTVAYRSMARKAQVEWHLIMDEVVAYAVDKLGVGWFFTSVPVLKNEEWEYDRCTVVFTADILSDQVLKRGVGIDWKDSLVLRNP